MEYRKFSQGYVLRLDPGEEIVDGLTRLAEQENIQLASVTGLGAANDITVGIFNNAEKQFQARHCQGEYEIASLVGSITRKDGEPYLHLHITFGSPTTGEVFGSEPPEKEAYLSRAVEYQEVTYEVAALVAVPSCLGYGYYGADEFVLNDATFCQDTQSDSVMLYAFNTQEGGATAMEDFLADYTENQNPQYDYVSKVTYQAEFESFRAMFLMLGGALSFIVGLVGVLNFFNAILTGILTRKREFAVLQSIGMTGRQLKIMLVWEGLFYALGSILIALVLALVLGPLSAPTLENLFWFFTYHLTVTPVLILLPIFLLLGGLVPLAVYRSVARVSVVERLREAEG